SDNIEFNDVGYILALTENSELNEAAIERYKKRFGENGTFRLVSSEEISDPENNPKEGLFSHTVDYNRLAQVAQKHPQMREIEIKSEEHYSGMIEISKSNPDVIPLFIKDSEGELDIIPSNSEEVNIEGKGFKLVYIGKSPQIEKEIKSTDFSA